MGPSPLVPRRHTRLALAAGLALVTFATPTGGAWAAPAAPPATGGTTLVTVEGTLEQDVLDDFGAHLGEAPSRESHPGESHPEHAHGEMVLDTTVRVGDEVLDVPEPVLASAGTTGGPSAGDLVVVTLRAEEGVTEDEAVRAAAQPAQDLPAAQVVAVAPATRGPSQEASQESAQAAPRSVLGQHTLTLLPVTWSTTPVTRSALTSLATSAAQYWSEQSGGRVTFLPTVADWRPIADPGSCDVAAIMDRALAAHGVPRPTGNAHVAVYFPTRSDCAFAGRASISGGNIWINGAPQADVLAHEIGHNLGIGHANTATCTSGAVRVTLSATCTTTAYADTADVMGYATSKPSGNLNTAFADHLGLATVHEVTTLPATIDIARLAEVDAVRAVKLPTAFGTVYVDFRPAAGRDVREPGWAGVQVHRLVPGSYPHTELLDMTPTTSRPFASPALATGGSWDIPGTGQRLTVTATSATVATLSVTSTATTPAPVIPPVPPTAPIAPPAPALGKDLTFVPVDPVRVLDTREGDRPLGAGETRDVVVAGTRGIPADARAVALNLTAVGASAGTYLRMWPAGQPMPESSVLNTDPSRVGATGLMLGVGSAGAVSVLNAVGRVHVVADVTGYYVASGGHGFGALTAPVRVLDTRLDGGALTDGRSRTIPLAGRHGVPADASAVVVNVTSVGAGGTGHLVGHPAGTARPLASTVNHQPGGNSTNRATVRLGGGALTVALQGAGAHVVVDLVGWFGPSGTGRFTPITPVRAFDTRRAAIALQQDESRWFGVRGAVGAPAEARTAVMVLTATAGSAPGSYVTAWTGTTPRPSTSDLNVRGGQSQANLALVPWSADGSVRLYNNLGALHLIGDVMGYFS